MTSNGKEMIDPPMLVVDDKVREEITESAAQLETKDKKAKDSMGEEVVLLGMLKPISRPPPYFPQWLKKKNEEGKFQNFIFISKQLFINLSLSHRCIGTNAWVCDVYEGPHYKKGER